MYLLVNIYACNPQHVWKSCISTNEIWEIFLGDRLTKFMLVHKFFQQIIHISYKIVHVIIFIMIFFLPGG